MGGLQLLRRVQVANFFVADVTWADGAQGSIRENKLGEALVAGSHARTRSPDPPSRAAKALKGGFELQRIASPEHFDNQPDVLRLRRGNQEREITRLAVH